jgi:hypothetical protein
MTTTPAQPDPGAQPAGDRPAARPLRYRGRRLDGPIGQFHAAVDALEADTVPYAYYLKVLAGREPPAPER